MAARDRVAKFNLVSRSVIERVKADIASRIGLLTGRLSLRTRLR